MQMFQPTYKAVVFLVMQNSVSTVPINYFTIIILYWCLEIMKIVQVHYLEGLVHDRKGYITTYLTRQEVLGIPGLRMKE